MRPTRALRGLFSKAEKPFHDPWHRREAWRYEAPFKPNDRLFGYQTMWKPTLAVLAVYWTFDEVVNHGPLKEVVWGKDEAHAEGEHH